jgi:anaerobic magnesium-protoporphyrin IX monomethyl ester cyclase
MKIIYLRPFLSGEMYEPPLGIGHIASYLRERFPNIEQEMLDLDVLKLKKEEAKKEIQKRNADILCISAFSYNRFDGFDLARMAKESGAYVIFGGQHTTFMDKDTLENVPEIDVIIRGEAEATMAEVVQRRLDGKDLTGVDGTSYIQDGKFVRNPDREFIDITNIPMPAYDLFPTEKYSYYGIMGTRGCPYSCNFCGSPKFWKRKLRLRDPIKVVDEIEFLIKKYGKKIVHMKDDVFTADKEWARKVMEEIERRNLNIEWECLTRVNLVDKEILTLMAKTGCKLIEYGIESGNEKIMRGISKGIVKSMVINAIQMTKDAGIGVGTFFMVGHPGETEETLKDTFDFAYSLRGDTVTFTLTDAIPGTELYDMATSTGYIPKNFSWAKADKRNFSGFPVPRFQTNSLPEEKMREYSRRFIMRFAFGRLFDLQDEKDRQYLFKNEYTPYHFTVKNKKDLKMFIEEMKKGWRLSPTKTKKMKGLSYFPYFMSRLAKNHGVRLYRKTMIKFKSNDGRIHEEQIDKNPESLENVPHIKNTAESS